MATITPPARVLLVRGGAVGDLLLLRRAIASLRAVGTTIGLLAPPAAEVLQGEGPAEVQEWIPWDHPDLTRLFAGEPSLPESLADSLRSYDAAVAYTRNEDFVSSLRAFVPTVLSLDPTRLSPGLHASVAFTAPCLALGGSQLVELPVLRPRPQDDEAILPFLQRLPPHFLAVHPGSGSPRKNWPATRFAELVRDLTGDSPFLVVKGPADETAVGGLLGRRSAVVASGLPLRVLGALLSRAGLYVGNDSGVSHLAAASGAPTFALFGPTPPDVWAPIGPRVACLQVPDGVLDGLERDEVVLRAKEALRSWELPGPPSG
jgi:heptosyltransferase-3